jgi:uncharacterized protein (DUF1330 family)
LKHESLLAGTNLKLTGDTTMTAVLIINYDVRDAQRLAEYRKLAGPILVGPGQGTLVASTDATIDLREGAGAGTTTVILEFASVAAAQAAFDSAAYQPLISERLASTTPRFAMIVPTVRGG